MEIEIAGGCERVKGHICDLVWNRSSNSTNIINSKNLKKKKLLEREWFENKIILK